MCGICTAVAANWTVYTVLEIIRFFKWDMADTENSAIVQGT